MLRPFAAMHRQVVVTGQRQKPTVTLFYILGSRNSSVYFSVASLCFTFLFLHLDFCNLSGRLLSFSLLLESRNTYRITGVAPFLHFLLPACFFPSFIHVFGGDSYLLLLFYYEF